MATGLEKFENARGGVKCEGWEREGGWIRGDIYPVVKGTERMPGRYSEGLRERMDLPLHFQPEFPTDTSTTASTSSTSTLC